MTDSAQGELSLRRLWVLMVTAFVDLLGYALVLPLLPFYATHFNASFSMVGWLLATFALGQLLTAPLWGRLSDRIGRRPVMMGSQFLAATAYLLFAFADSVEMLFLMRFAQGAGGGTLAVNQAYVSDIVTPDQRSKALGWITAATSLGVVIGPAIGSFSFEFFNRSAPGLIAASFCLANILFLWIWLPEPITRAQRAAKLQETHKSQTPILAMVGDVLRRPHAPVHAMIWVYAGGMLAFMTASNMMSLYLAERFGVTEGQIGGFYSVIGVVSFVMRALILGICIEKFGERRTQRFGGFTMAAGLLAAPFAASPWIFLLVILAMPVGTALLFPTTTSLVSRYADPVQVGQVHGVQQAFGGSSRLIAPIAGGYLFAMHPPTLVGGDFGGAFPFWAGAAVLTFTMLFALSLRPPPDAAKSAAEAA